MSVPSHPIEPLLAERYRRDDVRAITAHLERAGAFHFPALATGLFPAAVAGTPALDYTGYRNVWIRDNVHVAYHFHVLGRHDLAVRTLAALTRFLRTQHDKIDAIVAGGVDPRNAMLRPHVRFDGERLMELPERWAHAQNDALGYWLWLAALLAQRGHWSPAQEDIALVASLVRYFEAIRFWEDEDSGHWEEARKVEASSIGAVTAALAAAADWLGSSRDFAPAVRSIAATAAANAQALATRGRAALASILPSECVQSDKHRRHDAALLFLVYPLRVVDDAMAATIVAEVVANLAGPHGIRRYIGDSYWCADYKRLLGPALRTVDFSTDMRARDRLLVPGGEAQWCLFDPIVSIVHGLEYRCSGDPQALLRQTAHLNRSLRQLTGTGTAFEPLRCPESYYRENGRYVPNDITPLLWTQANLRLALHHMEESADREAQRRA